MKSQCEGLSWGKIVISPRDRRGQPSPSASLLTEMQSDAAPFYGKLKLEFQLEVAVTKVGLR